MSSDTPRFTDMLLSPRPFRSRLVVHLEVICLELRPPPGAIHSVRDTAHTFTVSRSSLSNAPFGDAAWPRLTRGYGLADEGVRLPGFSVTRLTAKALAENEWVSRC
jgi:hypothetical protein